VFAGRRYCHQGRARRYLRAWYYNPSTTNCGNANAQVVGSRLSRQLRCQTRPKYWVKVSESTRSASRHPTPLIGTCMEGMMAASTLRRTRELTGPRPGSTVWRRVQMLGQNFKVHTWPSTRRMKTSSSLLLLAAEVSIPQTEARRGHS